MPLLHRNGYANGSQLPDSSISTYSIQILSGDNLKYTVNDYILKNVKR